MLQIEDMHAVLRGFRVFSVIGRKQAYQKNSILAEFQKYLTIESFCFQNIT